MKCCAVSHVSLEAPTMLHPNPQRECHMRPNRFRALLNANQPTIGTHLLSTWPTLVELVGQAGNYDYVEFTAEYSPFDMHDLDNLGRALELKNRSEERRVG